MRVRGCGMDKRMVIGVCRCWRVEWERGRICPDGMYTYMVPALYWVLSDILCVLNAVMVFRFLETMPAD